VLKQREGEFVFILVGVFVYGALQTNTELLKKIGKNIFSEKWEIY